MSIITFYVHIPESFSALALYKNEWFLEAIGIWGTLLESTPYVICSFYFFSLMPFYKMRTKKIQRRQNI